MRFALAAMLLLTPMASAEIIVGLDHMPTVEAGDSWNGHTVTFSDPTLWAIGLDADLPIQLDAPGIRYVEQVMAYTADFVPNDSYWGHPQHYSATVMEADDLWDTTTGGTTFDVCIADTGIYLAHEDIDATRYLGGWDFINDDADPAETNHYHGTYVAGNLLGTIDNTVGMSGIAQQEFYVAKVLDDADMDGTASGSSTSIGQAIRWCADQGAKIINLSLGGPGESTYQSDAVRYATSKGALVFASSGNSGTEEERFPAAIAETIAVGCVTSSKSLCGFSTTGEWVDLVAAGSSVISTGETATDAYVAWSGTSASAPNAAGLAALVWEANPTLSNWDVRHALRLGAEDLGTAGHDNSYGYGLANGPDAHTAAQGLNQGLSTLFTETFEDSEAQGWTLTGLWHLDNTCTLATDSGGTALLYANGSCDYDEGYNSGSAMFTVDLSSATGASLAFSHKWDTHDSTPDTTSPNAQPSQDQMRVEVRPSGSDTWTSIAFWDSRDVEPANFETVDLSLTPFVGDELDVRFRFRNGIGINNANPGWAIDNVIVRADAGAMTTTGQDWFFTDSSVGMQGDEDYRMERGGGAGSSSLIISDADTDRIWAANEAATTATNFGQSDWTLFLDFQRYMFNSAGVSVTMELGSTDPSGNFVSQSPPVAQTRSTEIGTMVFQLDPAADVVVPQGTRLAIKMDAPVAPGQQIEFELRGDNSPSYLQSGASDPGYPTPGSATLVLLLGGLLVVSLASLKRR